MSDAITRAGSERRRMLKVSVIVPVFDPGERIEPLLDSLLGQSLPAEDYELIFVDDGSTDGTGERLEALAAEHANVRTIRIEHSGWPGRPRNVGLDAARGEFVFFADHDDHLGTEALERLYATAVADRADVVIGKVVGHGKAVPRTLFRENVHELGLRAAPFNLLTPHKLFRRALLDEHAIRFPEGKHRLGDQVFVVRAYFTAGNMAILADYPCYHRVHRNSETNASSAAPDPAEYFDDVRSVLDVVDAHTEPGEFREALYGRWYRGDLLGRLRGNAFLGREEEHRRGMLGAVQELMAERFPERLDAGLGPALRMRAALARRDDYDGLVALAEYEQDLKASARVRSAQGDGTWMTLGLECWLRMDDGEPLTLRREGDRLLLALPDALQARTEPAELDVTETVQQANLQLVIRRDGDAADWLLPVEAELRIPDGDQIRPSLVATARIAPTIAIAGTTPLEPGLYELRAVVSIAGFTAQARLRRGDGLFRVTVTPEDRVYREGSVPAPPERSTVDELRLRAGRLRRRVRGPRA
jgi:glycosyltransferase involved in cell wall biosynthesis